MRNNTVTYKGFIFASLYWIVVIYIAFNTFVYKTISGLSYVSSHLVLIGIVLATTVVNALISMKFARNERSAIITTLLAYGIYAFVAYGIYLNKVTNCIVAISGLIAVVYLAIAFNYGMESISNSRRKLKIRFRRSYIGVRNIAGAAGCVFIVYMVICANVVGGLATSSEVKGTAVYGDEYALAENIDMFLLLQQDEWEKIDLNKKLSVLQTVLNTEGRYLSFNKKITLYASDLTDGVLGYTDYDNNKIQIDIDELGPKSDSRECVEIILHEAYHVSQHQYKEIYESLSESDKNCIFMLDAAIYANEIENYTSGSDDYYAYRSQKLEADARGYALANTQVIFDRIDEYLNGEAEEG